MESNRDFEEKLWKAIKGDRTMMLGLDGVEEGHTRPMTAQLDGDSGPTIWFFTSTDNALVQSLGEGAGRATGAFVDKGHDLFASITGSLREDTNPAMVEKLWNPFVAAWYEGGKDDPKLALLRLDAEHAEVWLNGSSLVAGMKMLFGADPKKDYQDKVRDIDLGARPH
jgi:general stress protein 26